MVGFRGVTRDGHAKMEAWMNFLLHQSLIARYLIRQFQW
jgi:hypothetical protein